MSVFFDGVICRGSEKLSGVLMAVGEICCTFALIMNGNGHTHVEHPEAWELLVSIDDRTVKYILFTPAVANSLITGVVARADASLQGLEDAVYDTPVLLGEYKRVRVVVHSSHFVLFPAAADDASCLSLLRQAFPDDNGDAAVCAMPENGVKIAYLLPQGLQAFLGRTFNYPMVCHHLVPFCEYFKGLQHADDVSRMFLHLDDERMDLAVYRDGGLLCANTYQFSNSQDAVYYALNVWKCHGLDQLADELQLMGNPEPCAAMTPGLREFVKLVMPAEFPAAAMRLGRNAMQAPLDLILLALCE